MTISELPVFDLVDISNKEDEKVKIRMIAEHSTRRSYRMPSRSLLESELSTELF